MNSMPEHTGLLASAIAAAKAGNKAEARRLLSQITRQDPNNESAWLWLSGVVEDDHQRIQCLEKVLKINPANPHALRGLAVLKRQTAHAQRGKETPRPEPPPILTAPPAPTLPSPPPSAPSVIRTGPHLDLDQQPRSAPASGQPAPTTHAHPPADRRRSQQPLLVFGLGTVAILGLTILACLAAVLFWPTVLQGKPSATEVAEGRFEAETPLGAATESSSLTSEPLLPTAPPLPITTPEPTCYGWKFTPFKYGDAEDLVADVGWRYIVIYFAIENCSEQPQIYSADMYAPFIYAHTLLDKRPVSQPSLGTSYISTNEGAVYPYSTGEDFTLETIWTIKGDSTDYETYLQREFGEFKFGSYTFDDLPPVPPRFRVFGSIAFRVAANTTGWTWVIPDVAEYPLDTLADVVFPYDWQPAYVRTVGDTLEIDKVGITLADAKRQANSLSIDVYIDNQGFQNFSAYKLGLWLFDSQGRPIADLYYNPFTCVSKPLGTLGLCWASDSVAPGQALSIQHEYPLPDNMSGSLFLEMVYGEGLSSDSSFDAPYWAVFELK